MHYFHFVVHHPFLNHTLFSTTSFSQPRSFLNHTLFPTTSFSQPQASDSPTARRTLPSCHQRHSSVLLSSSSPPKHASCALSVVRSLPARSATRLSTTTKPTGSEVSDFFPASLFGVQLFHNKQPHRQLHHLTRRKYARFNIHSTFFSLSSTRSGCTRTRIGFYTCPHSTPLPRYDALFGAHAPTARLTVILHTV